jgi:hypothetical protein
MNDNLNIKCEHLVCIPVGNGIMQHIIFKPAPETVRMIADAVNGDANPRTITVDDISGKHVSKKRHEFFRYRETYGTIVLTTLEIS